MWKRDDVVSLRQQLVNSHGNGRLRLRVIREDSTRRLRGSISRRVDYLTARLDRSRSRSRSAYNSAGWELLDARRRICIQATGLQDATGGSRIHLRRRPTSNPIFRLADNRSQPGTFEFAGVSCTVGQLGDQWTTFET
jgi:hypothetical protein